VAKFQRADGTWCKKFDWRFGARSCKNQLSDWIAQYQAMDGGGLETLVGIADTRVRDRIAAGKEFIYGDHAYFDRGWDKNHFRLIRNDAHLTYVVPRPDDRLKRWNVQIEPWRKNGRSIVVIVPGFHQEVLYDIKDWQRKTIEDLHRFTDRPIITKVSKGRLREMLLEERDAFALVCYASVAGMEAALMGIPVFSSPRCCSWPVNAGSLKNIDQPEYPDRHAWACSLAYASWSAEELESIDFRDYRYSVKESICA
jgi:hypothetical protein